MQEHEVLVPAPGLDVGKGTFFRNRILHLTDVTAAVVGTVAQK